MIKKTQLTDPQQVNACTLISLEVIQAICFSMPSNRNKSIQAAFENGQIKFKEHISQTSLDSSAGLMESEAYEYIKRRMNKQPTKTLTNQVDSSSIETLIENRTDMEQELFIQFNGELIANLAAKYNKEATWLVKASDEELRKLAATYKPEQTQTTLEEQFLEEIKRLDNVSGISINYEGHTISLTKINDQYFCFDSQTGELIESDSAEEIADEIYNSKIKTSQAHSIDITHFEPSERYLLHLRPKVVEEKKVSPSTTPKKIEQAEEVSDVGSPKLVETTEEVNTYDFFLDKANSLSDGSIEHRFYILLNTKLDEEQIKSLFSDAGFQEPEITKKNDQLALFINKRFDEQVEERPEDASITQAIQVLEDSSDYPFTATKSLSGDLEESIEIVKSQISELIQVAGENFNPVYLNAFQYAHFDMEQVQALLDEKSQLEAVQNIFDVILEGSPKGFPTLTDTVVHGIEEPVQTKTLIETLSPKSPTVLLDETLAEPIQKGKQAESDPLLEKFQKLEKQTQDIEETELSPASKAELLRKEFLAKHAKYKQEQSFQWLRRTGIDNTMSWQQILDHAQGKSFKNANLGFFNSYSGCRSLLILKDMGIINDKGDITSDSVRTVVKPEQIETTAKMV